MHIHTLSRCSIALLLATFVSGCSLTSHKNSDRSNECRWNPNSCMYNGAYEPGERGYAEQEAARLNQAESARLRR
ncbi:MAG: hypothetical protein ABI155_15680 [Paralcaligenes sp.]